MAVRCRKIDGYTGAVNASETGQASADNWLNAVNAVGDAAKTAAGYFGIGLGTIALVLGAVMLLNRRI